MDFLHCNTCYATPSSEQQNNLVFYFGSCGHLFCYKCLRSQELSTPRKGTTCHVCKKACNYVVINREMKSDLQMYFRNPRDLATQFLQKMKQVLDFQAQQRASLQKHKEERINKAIRFAKCAQAEINKRTEMERTFNAERHKMQTELEQQREHSKNLEEMIAEKNREIQQMRQQMMPGSAQRSKTSNVGPSLNGVTPLNTLSFINCVTSTPVNGHIFGGSGVDGLMGERNRFGSSDDRQFSPYAGHPAEFDSPISGNYMNTPAILGLTQRPPDTISRPKNYF